MAELGRARSRRGDLEVEGGVVERDASGEPTGVLREEAAWRFRERFPSVSEDEWLEVTRAGVSSRTAAASLPSTTRTAGSALPDLPAAARARGADAPGLAVAPVQEAARARGARPPLPLRRRLPAARLPEGVHGRNARLADRVDARRLRRPDHERRGARGDRSRAARAPAGRSACTRSATARTAKRSTRSSRRRTSGRRAACGSGSSTPSASHRRISAASPSSASPARCSSRTRRPTAISPSASGPDRLEGAYAFRSLLRLRRGPRERLGRADRGARPAGRDPRSASLARSTSDPAGAWSEALTVEEALHATHGRPGLARGRRAHARKASPRLPRRPGRPLARPGRVPAGRARVGRGRRDDGRRPLGAQPSALGLSARRIDRREGRRLFGADPAAYDSRAAGACGAGLRDPRRAVRPRARHERARDRARDRARRPAGCSTSARARSSRSSPIRRSRRYLADDARRAASRSAWSRSRTPSCRGRLRSRRRRVVVPLGRGGTSGSRSSSRRSDRADGSRSGGRSSATRDKPDAFITATSPLLDGPADASPAARRGGTAARSRSTARPGSPRSRHAGFERRRARGRRAGTRTGTRTAFARSTGRSRRSRDSTRTRRRDPRRRSRASPSASSAAASSERCVTSLYTARKPA